MARWVKAEPGTFVLELGPGTGAVTQAMIELGLAEQQLVAIEKSARLAELLRHKFPNAHIITGDAWELDKLLKERLGEDSQACAVVSSLPLRNYTRNRTRALVQKIYTALVPSGKWIQFSYHLRSLHPAANGYFRLVAWEIVWRNVPPARVNVYQKIAGRH